MYRPVFAVPQSNKYFADNLEQVVDGVGAPYPRDQGYFCGSVHTVGDKDRAMFYRVQLEHLTLVYKVGLQAHPESDCEFEFVFYTHM
jgi:hypothetical protein